MLVPTWLIERGYRFGIVAADCVEVPHVHVTGHGGTATLGLAEPQLAPARVVRMRGYTLRRVTEITSIVREHEKGFTERWHEFCRQADVDEDIGVN